MLFLDVGISTERVSLETPYSFRCTETNCSFVLFFRYLDQFRDPLEVEAELLKRRLRMSRVDERPQQPKYPDMNYAENKKKLPAWQHARLISENSGQGKNFALWNNPID